MIDRKDPVNFTAFKYVFQCRCCCEDFGTNSNRAESCSLRCAKVSRDNKRKSAIIAENGSLYKHVSKCLICNSDFRSRYADTKACSSSCARRLRYLPGGSRDQAKEVMRECVHCGSRFPSRRPAKMCSDECRVAVQAANRKARAAVCSEEKVERRRASKREYNKRNIEKNRNYRRKYYHDHIEASRAGGRRRYEENRDAILAQTKIYKARMDQEALKKRHRDYHAAHRDEANEGRTRRYRQSKAIAARRAANVEMSKLKEFIKNDD